MCGTALPSSPSSSSSAAHPRDYTTVVLARELASKRHLDRERSCTRRAPTPGPAARQLCPADAMSMAAACAPARPRGGWARDPPGPPLLRRLLPVLLVCAAATALWSAAAPAEAARPVTVHVASTLAVDAVPAAAAGRQASSSLEVAEDSETAQEVFPPPPGSPVEPPPATKSPPPPKKSPSPPPEPKETHGNHYYKSPEYKSPPPPIIYPSPAPVLPAAELPTGAPELSPPPVPTLT